MLGAMLKNKKSKDLSMIPSQRNVPLLLIEHVFKWPMQTDSKGRFLGVNEYIGKEVGLARKYQSFLATLTLNFLGLFPIIVDKNW